MNWPADFINQFICGDSIEVLKKIPNDSIDCCVTSPPYWALRDYGHKGQLGLEETYQEYLEKLWKMFDEVRRVLKPTGTCFVNLGETYGTASGAGDRHGKQGTNRGIKYNDKWRTGGRPGVTGFEKCLLQIPARFSIGMTDRGWILRSKIIWHKPNPMPSSVEDRLGVDYEEVFFFVKEKKYFFDMDSIREPYGPDQRLAGIRRARELGYDGKGTYQDWYNNKRTKKGFHNHTANLTQGYGQQKRGQQVVELLHPIGRAKRCVWTIPTEAYRGAHFATFPTKLIEPMIKAGCPDKVCIKCGTLSKKLYKYIGEDIFAGGSGKAGRTEEQMANSGKWQGKNCGRIKLGPRAKEKELIGRSDCGCKEEFRGGVVLDPFMGSGTTAYIAREFGRQYVGIELNGKYIELANKRLAQQVLFG